MRASRATGYITKTFAILFNVATVLIVLAAAGYVALSFHLKGTTLSYGGGGTAISYDAINNYRYDDMDLGPCGSYIPYDILTEFRNAVHAEKIARGIESNLEVLERSKYEDQYPAECLTSSTTPPVVTP